MKKVVDCYYVHKSNTEELYECFPNDKSLIETVDEFNKTNTKYEIIKYNPRKRIVSFIDSPDWDTSNEPMVGDCYIINIKDGSRRFRCGSLNNPQIYHHKWRFVDIKNYKGFDIDRSIDRTRRLEMIESFNDPNVKRRIGYKNYWINWCQENGIEV